MFEQMFQMIREIHERRPELRFQQIMSSAASLGGWNQNDLYYCPDNLIINGLSSFLNVILQEEAIRK